MLVKCVNYQNSTSYMEKLQQKHHSIPFEYLQARYNLLLDIEIVLLVVNIVIWAILLHITGNIEL